MIHLPITGICDLIKSVYHSTRKLREFSNILCYFLSYSFNAEFQCVYLRKCLIKHSLWTSFLVSFRG